MSLYRTLLIISLIVGIIVGGFQIKGYLTKEESKESHQIFKPSTKNELDFKISMKNIEYNVTTWEWENFTLKGNFTYTYSIFKGFSAPLLISNQEQWNRYEINMFSKEGESRYTLIDTVPYEITAWKNEIVIEKIGTSVIENNLSFKADFSKVIEYAPYNNFSHGDYIIISTYPNVTTRFSPVDMNKPQEYRFTPRLVNMEIDYEKLIRINESINQNGSYIQK